MHVNSLKKYLCDRNKKTNKYNLSNLGIALFLIGNTSWIVPVLAQQVPKPVSELPAGTEIKNQASGSFEDPNTPGVENVIQSNEVIATIAEIAAIAVTPAGIIEAPKAIPGGGKFQGNGKVNQGDIVYYNYIITNVGNDITQFFIPGVASLIQGGTIAGTIKITEVDVDGVTGATAPKVVDIAIPPEGGNTGADGNGSNGLLGTDGIIPIGGTVRVRIPIKVTGAPDMVVKVVLGDTGANDNSAGTQNQSFVTGNQDVFTQDNTDDTLGETLGLPFNGDSINHRQEASAIQSTKVLLPPKDPNLLLVKRITKINDRTSTVGGNVLGDYIDEINNPYDDNSITLVEPEKPIRPDTDKWPDLNGDGKPDLIGGIDGGNVIPRDEIEYTIYYLSSGEQPANGVLFCDRVPENATFIPTAFNSFPTRNTTGLPGDNRGIIWQNNGAIESLTNSNDGDTAEYLSPGIDPTIKYPGIKCDGSNTNGVVVVKLENVPNATAPGTPINSYGFIRFRGRVK